MSLEPGTRLGPYEITAAIGAGGMGEVYRAKDTKLGREVAIKLWLEEVRALQTQRECSMRMTVAFSVLCMAGTISLSAQTSIKAAGNVETAEQLVSTKVTGTVPLAESSPRFTDNGNGTVTDGDTGLIYLRNASCAALAGTDVDGKANWSTAQAAAEALSEGTCGLTDGSLAGDWRLPTKEEWEGILKSSCDFDPEIVGNGTPTSDCYSTTSDGSAENGWASGVESEFYWSSSSYAGNRLFAWLVATGFGSIDGGYRAGKGYVWPVRGGQ